MLTLCGFRLHFDSSLRASAAPAVARAAAGEDAGPADPVELLIIGGGPHGLTLMLRLLEEEPELLTEGARATLAMDDFPTVAALGSWYVQPTFILHGISLPVYAFLPYQRTVCFRG